MKNPWLVLGSFCLAMTLGCGKSTGNIKGTVTLENDALKFGTVTIQASDDQLHQVTIQADGTFEVNGVRTGKAKFAVVCQDPKVVSALNELAGKAKDSTGRLGKMAKTVLKNPTLIPGEYADLAKELLVFDIASGTNTIDLHLRKKIQK